MERKARVATRGMSAQSAGPRAPTKMVTSAITDADHGEQDTEQREDNAPRLELTHKPMTASRSLTCVRSERCQQPASRLCRLLHRTRASARATLLALGEEFPVVSRLESLPIKVIIVRDSGRLNAVAKGCIQPGSRTPQTRNNSQVSASSKAATIAISANRRAAPAGRCDQKLQVLELENTRILGHFDVDPDDTAVLSDVVDARDDHLMMTTTIPVVSSKPKLQLSVVMRSTNQG